MDKGGDDGRSAAIFMVPEQEKREKMRQKIFKFKNRTAGPVAENTVNVAIANIRSHVLARCCG